MRRCVNIAVAALVSVFSASACFAPQQNGAGAQDDKLLTDSHDSQISTVAQDASVSTFASFNTKGSDHTEKSGLMEMPALTEDDTIIRHSGFVISYNSEWYIPNWVAYELTREELEGDEERGDRMFSMDPSYRKTQSMREDYRDSDWTKGHMAPAADFSWSPDAMDETFYLTNVCPQDKTLNRNDWEYLERQVRNWARKYGKAWVVTGPIVNENKYGTIGERGVVVPDSFFKAVLVQKSGKYRSIAFIMDNDARRYWLNDCAISVNELEDITGIDFFPALDDAVEDSTEAQLRLSDWGINVR